MNARTPSNPQAGFTLIELIAVILILGILSALALPKFINMGSDARSAKTSAIYGSVRAAAQMTYAASLIRNNLGATGSVTLQNGSTTTIATAYGYPDSSATGIVFATGLDTNLTPTLNQDQITISPSAWSATATLTIVPNGATTPANCVVTYIPATSASNPPAISVLTSGC